MGAPRSLFDWLRLVENRVDLLATGAGCFWQRIGTILSPKTSGDDVHLYDAGDLVLHDGAPGNVTFEVDGATGLADSQQGYQYQSAAPAGHFLRGDGAQYIDEDLAGGVSGRVTHAAATTSIDSNAIVQNAEPGIMWSGQIWVNDT